MQLSLRPFASLVMVVAGIVALLTSQVSAAELGVRIRFGLTDERSTKWDGTITPAAGRVTQISGWRFAKGDAIDGVKGWSA